MSQYHVEGVEWSRRSRPRQQDQGHTIIRTGVSGQRGRFRHHIECQCGKVVSAQSISNIFGADRAFQGHARHVREELGASK